MASGRQVSILYNVASRNIIDKTRLLYRPQIVVNGNMKLVHIRMKRGEDDVSLSDGELFMVQRGPYAQHLVSAPDRQPVRSSYII